MGHETEEEAGAVEAPKRRVGIRRLHVPAVSQEQPRQEYRLPDRAERSCRQQRLGSAVRRQNRLQVRQGLPREARE